MSDAVIEVLPNFRGVLPGLPASVYHASAALGSTQIKAARRTLAHFKAALDQRINIPASREKAFRFGDLAHSAVLEQSLDRFAVIPEDAPRRPTAAQINAKRPSPETITTIAWWRAFEETTRGKVLIDRDDFVRLEELFDAFCDHPRAHQFVSLSAVEQSFFTLDETGLWLKARPDGYCQDDEGGDFIIEFKSSSKPLDMFNREIARYGYDISAAHYIAVVEAVTGRKIRDFYYIAQESSAPYELMIYRASNDLLARAEVERRKLLNQISVAMRTGEFPGYPDEILEIDVPAWVYKLDSDFGEAS